MFFCYFCLFPFPLYPRAVVTSVDNLLDRSRFPLPAALGMLLSSPEAAQYCPSALQLLQGHPQLQSLGAFLCPHQTHREKKAAEMGATVWPASAPCSRDRSPGARFQHCAARPQARGSILLWAGVWAASTGVRRAPWRQQGSAGVKAAHSLSLSPGPGRFYGGNHMPRFPGL